MLTMLVFYTYKLLITNGVSHLSSCNLECLIINSTTIILQWICDKAHELEGYTSISWAFTNRPVYKINWHQQSVMFENISRHWAMNATRNTFCLF